MPESHLSSEESHERMTETSDTTLTQTVRFPESQDNLDSGRGSLRSYTLNDTVLQTLALCCCRKLEVHKVEKVEKVAAAPIPVKRKADNSLSTAAKLRVVKRIRPSSATTVIEKPLPTTALPQPTVTDAVVGMS